MKRISQREIPRDGDGVNRAIESSPVAVNLGRPGFPLAERLPVALATSYKHLAGRGFATVFEVLEADETK